MAENREQRRQWMEKLQDQNPALLEKENGHGHEHGHGHRHGHEHGHSHEHGHGSATLEVCSLNAEWLTVWTMHV